MDAVWDVDVLIFGGGCAGLWLLDDLRRQGVRVLLLESNALGGLQTTGSQGILHGGVKYALSGLLSKSASAVSLMPGRWRDSFTGKVEPDLSATRLRSEFCYLWRSATWQSWAGMLGAQAMLQVKPVSLAAENRPAILVQCPGEVFRLDETVIDTASFVRALSERNRGLIWKYDFPDSLNIYNANAAVPEFELHEPGGARFLRLRPRQIVLTAGAGNEALRTLLNLPSTVAQRRPLHMVVARGALPQFCGHCVDGAKTRVTITSDVDSHGRTIWQIGGQVAEDGVALEPEALILHVQRELEAVLPGWKSAGLNWMTYRIDRAERSTSGGIRPDDVQLIREGNTITAWPTKLVLAPRLSERVREELQLESTRSSAEFLEQAREFLWPTPDVAKYPWELDCQWQVNP